MWQLLIFRLEILSGNPQRAMVSLRKLNGLERRAYSSPPTACKQERQRQLQQVRQLCLSVGLCSQQGPILFADSMYFPTLLLNNQRGPGGRCLMVRNVRISWSKSYDATTPAISFRFLTNSL